MSRVSYAMMHPEGAGEMTAAVRKALDGLIADARDAGRHRARPTILELGDRRQPDHASPRCSASTRRRSAPRRSRWRRTGRSDERPPSWTSAPTPAPASTCCRASPGTSAPTPPGVILAEAPHLADAVTLRRRRRHERRDRAGQPRPAARRVEPDRAGVRGRPDLAAASGPRPARSSASGSTATTLEPRFRVIGVDAWSDEPAFAAAIAETGITGICGSGIIEVDRRAVPRRRHHRGRHHRRRARGAHAAGRPRRPHVRATSSTTATAAPACGSRSPRTTSARSSSPRPRSTPASGC